jgi:hypothetical protein
MWNLGEKIYESRRRTIREDERVKWWETEI